MNNKAADAVWKPFRIAEFVSRDTTIAENTKGVAGVHVLRRKNGTVQWTTHNSDILFSFVMDGPMTLEGEDKEPYDLVAGDAFVIPPDMQTRYSNPSGDLEILEVSLPGIFDTKAE